MNGYEFYKVYEPIRLHFTTTYDLFKYASRSKSINIKSFEVKKDRILFESWANVGQSDKKSGKICLANFVYNKPDWFYKSHDEALEVYYKWRGIVDELKRVVSSDIDKLVQTKQEKNFTREAFFTRTPKGNKPPLLQMFLSGIIGKETILFLEEYYHFLDQWQDSYEIDPLVFDQIHLLKKYKNFIVNSTTLTKLEGALEL